MKEGKKKKNHPALGSWVSSLAKEVMQYQLHAGELKQEDRAGED